MQFRLLMKGTDSVAKQVTCDSCRRSFLVPDQIGDYWVLCPHCEKVNRQAGPDIQKTSGRRATFVGFFGIILLIPGFFGGIFGAFLCLLAAANSGMTLSLPGILLISSSCSSSRAAS
jgi:hypothetical protein